MSSDDSKAYTAKIIRAPALIHDTKVFLSCWDEALSVDENIQKAISDNIFARPARFYVKQFLTAFRERYVFGDERDAALRKLVRRGKDNAVIDRILYYYTTHADNLLYDFVVNYIFAAQSRGVEYISTKDAQEYTKKLSDEGKTSSKWGDTVCNRVARNILTSLRDFHILEGNVKKRIAPVYLPIEAFLYIAFSIGREVNSGDKVVNHQDWKLFLIDTATVERLFLEAHQRGFLSYQTAGNLMRIEYRFKSIGEVVDAIV